MRTVVRPYAWVAWGKCWAVQAFFYPGLSLGVHVDLCRPALDVHIGIVTIAVGRNPHLTDELERRRHSSRGFLFTDDPVL